MKCNEVENVFKADACVELEADVRLIRAISPGIAQASLVDFDRHALVCGALWDWISGL